MQGRNQGRDLVYIGGWLCTCYVRLMSEEDRFGIRYGAHAMGCPVYAKHGPSLDSVDRKHDRDLRWEHTTS